MKKKKIKCNGILMQEAAMQPAQPINHTNFTPLRDLNYTPVVVRPKNAFGAKKGPQVINILSDDEIAKMDERNAEVDEMTCEYIMNLLDESGDVSAEEIGLDAETATSILDEFERVLSEFGFYINRPTIVQCVDGEHIIRSSYDDEPVDADSGEPVTLLMD